LKNDELFVPPQERLGPIAHPRWGFYFVKKPCGLDVVPIDRRILPHQNQSKGFRGKHLGLVQTKVRLFAQNPSRSGTNANFFAALLNSGRIAEKDTMSAALEFQ